MRNFLNKPMNSKLSGENILKIARVIGSETGIAAFCAILGMLLMGLLIRPGLAPEFTTHVLSSLGLLLGAFLYQQIARYLLMDSEKAKAVSPPASILRSVQLVGGYFALSVLGSFIVSLVMNQLGAPVQEQAQILKIIGQGFSWRIDLLTLIFAAVIVAPIAEEWLLRGLLFRRLNVQCGLPSAYIVSCLVFAGMHANLQGFVVYAWLGYVFARCYQHTGRLWTAMLVHAGNNAMTLILLLAKT